MVDKMVTPDGASSPEDSTHSAGLEPPADDPPYRPSSRQPTGELRRSKRRPARTPGGNAGGGGTAPTPDDPPAACGAPQDSSGLRAEDAEGISPSVAGPSEAAPPSNQDTARGGSSGPRESISGGVSVYSALRLPHDDNPLPVVTGTGSLLPYDRLSEPWKSVTEPLRNVPDSAFITSGPRPRADALLAEAVGAGTPIVDGEADWRVAAKERLKDRIRGRIPVPPEVPCDRTCLLHPRDAVYVDRMAAYLFAEGEGMEVPFLDDQGLCVHVGSDEKWARETLQEWLSVCVTGRYIAYEDFLVVRRQDQTELDSIRKQENGNVERLLQPIEWFPPYPEFFRVRFGVRRVSMPVVKALYYFAHVVQRAGSALVRKRWETALCYEIVAHGLVALESAWSRPLVDRPKLFVAPALFVEWIHELRNAPDIRVFSLDESVQYRSINLVRMHRILEYLGKTNRRLQTRCDPLDGVQYSFLWAPTTYSGSADGLLPIVPRSSRGRSDRGYRLRQMASGGVGAGGYGSSRGSEIPFGTPPFRGVKRSYSPPPPQPIGGSSDIATSSTLVGESWLRSTVGVPSTVMSRLHGPGPFYLDSVMGAMIDEYDRLSAEVSRLNGLLDRWSDWNDRRARRPWERSDPYGSSQAGPSRQSYADPYGEYYSGFDPYPPNSNKYGGGAGPSDPYA